MIIDKLCKEELDLYYNLEESLSTYTQNVQNVEYEILGVLHETTHPATISFSITTNLKLHTKERLTVGKIKAIKRLVVSYFPSNTLVSIQVDSAKNHYVHIVTYFVLHATYFESLSLSLPNGRGLGVGRYQGYYLPSAFRFQLKSIQSGNYNIRLVDIINELKIATNGVMSSIEKL